MPFKKSENLEQPKPKRSRSKAATPPAAADALTAIREDVNTLTNQVASLMSPKADPKPKAESKKVEHVEEPQPQPERTTEQSGIFGYG